MRLASDTEVHQRTLERYVESGLLCFAMPKSIERQPIAKVHGLISVSQDGGGAKLSRT